MNRRAPFVGRGGLASTCAERTVVAHLLHVGGNCFSWLPGLPGAHVADCLGSDLGPEREERGDDRNKR